MSLTQGVHYGVIEDTYHKDPTAENSFGKIASLSGSLAKVVIEKSPRHAMLKHPRLNPNFENEDVDKFNIGKTAHSLMLSDPRRFKIIDPDDHPSKDGVIPTGWTNKSIKEARDTAYSQGKTPLLLKQWVAVNQMVVEGRKQLLLPECEAKDAFIGGQSEVTLIWKEYETEISDEEAQHINAPFIYCRARIDHMSNIGNFFNYKTTDTNANPEAFGRTFFNLDYDLSDAFYRRGMKKLFKLHNPSYRSIVQECDEPYELSVIATDPESSFVADRKAEYAIRLWLNCLKSGNFPGYTKRTCYLNAPVYHTQKWLDREGREEIVSEEKKGDAV